MKNGLLYTVRANRERIFTPDEWNRFFNALTSKRQKLTFKVLINTGARINEARHIKIGDINFQKNTISLRVTKKRSGFADGRIRTIPISNSFKEYLKNFKDGNKENYLGLLSTNAANICLKKTLKEIGVKDYYMFSVHNIRKTLENWLMSMDVSPAKLMLHFGHDMHTATRHYLFSQNIKQNREKIRQVIGGLYYSDGKIADIYDRIKHIEKKLGLWI